MELALPVFSDDSLLDADDLPDDIKVEVVRPGSLAEGPVTEDFPSFPVTDLPGDVLEEEEPVEPSGRADSLVDVCNVEFVRRDPLAERVAKVCL